MTLRSNSLFDTDAQRRPALLPILHAVQDATGLHPARGGGPTIAQGLNLSRAEVHGVVSYYHHFRSSARRAAGGAGVPGRGLQGHGCRGADGARAAGCWAAGHATRADGAVTLEPVYCLGLCASSPAITVDDRLHARVTPQRLDQIVAPLGAA
jgi:formate dehydrogenase subunit gamma